MKDTSDNSNDYDIVIIECCENCETHQNFSRHSQWKYFEQFNQLKRKIQKFIVNTVVIKNPVPDELIKTNDIKNEKNLFINKDTNEKIIFPRIGSFEIYIYNVLISSKLLTTQWPNHYKILQVIGNIIEDKKKGLNLDKYSVYHELPASSTAGIVPQPAPTKSIEVIQKRSHRIVSKKKKETSQLASKAYKSIDKSSYPSKEAKSTLQPLSTKLIELDSSPPRKQRYANRNLESKAQKRIKLPSLNNSIVLKQESHMQKQRIEELPQRQQSVILQISSKQQNGSKMLEPFKQNPMARNFSQTTQGQKISLLDLRQQSFNRNYMDFTQQIESDALKFLQNRSVQYSQQQDGKQLMNRSIQYEQQQGFYCDFGVQIENLIVSVQKKVNNDYVQTERIEVINQPKPLMFDEMVEVNIVNKKIQHEKSAQTNIKQFVDENVDTDHVAVANKGLQFPEEAVKTISDTEPIDSSFNHLSEKRKNIIDNDCYSINRFEQKSTKYKWIGRANLSQNYQQLKRKIFVECLVFSVYNYFGIKTPSRRLSYQPCCNVIGDKVKQNLLHVMTSQNPQLQYLSQFQQYYNQTQTYPISEIITFKSSKKPIKFTNYGGLLALAYFLNDFQVYNASNCQVGLVVVNEAVKQIHKLSSLQFLIHPTNKNNDDQIIINLNNNGIKLNRLSQVVQLQFFAMLSKITDPQVFKELIKYINDIFIHMATTHQQFRSTVASLKLEKSFETQTIEQFILMIENRRFKIEEYFRGKLYTYKKYRTLTPAIKYKLPFEHRMQRRLIYKQKSVDINDIAKYVRNQDNIVIIEGEDGIGKSTILNDISKKLKENQKLNIIEFYQIRKQKNRIRDQLFNASKNIVFIDNMQLYQAEVLSLIDRYSNGNNEVSFCIATTKAKHSDILKNRYTNFTLFHIKILPLDADEIKNYLSKTINNQSFTDKKDIIEKLLSNKHYFNILGNPFYLNLYSTYLSRIDCEKYEIRQKDLTAYMILKQHFSYCTTVHMQEMKEMAIGIKQVLPSLRRIAFEYYHNGMMVNEVIKDLIAEYEENQLIRNQIVYYPINLESVIPTSYKAIFSHNLFLNYFLVEAYCYFVEKGYRDMHMDKLFSNNQLMDLIKQRYKLEYTYSQLIEVVHNSKKFKNTTEASSNAITLLSKMQFVFSNMNFDQCNISQADLSGSIFYQCSFRSADLQNTILYKSQMISCVFDNAVMNKINLFSKKYEIEFTAMATSLSVDGKKLAFGCGNYLIIINSETGAEMKRIQAHLDVIRLVKYTRDGKSLITVADDKTLRIWDTYTYKSVVFKLPQKGSISYSNQTETIASVNKNSLKVWNLKSMANEVELQGHTEPITIVQFSFDGQWILTGSKDSTLRLWNLKGQQKVLYKSHDSQIIAGKLSPARRTMVSSSRSKDIIMWQVQSGTKITSKKFINEITEICLQDKEKYIIVTFANDNNLVILDFHTFDIAHVLAGHKSKIMSISFDHSYKKIISLGKDRTARVWEFDNIMEIEVRTPKMNKKIHSGPVLAIAYDKVKRKYATSHQNGEINIWEVRDNSLINQVMSHNGQVKCLAFDLSSKLYSGGSDGTLRIWNFEAQRQPRKIEIHSSQMLQLKLSQKNRMIVTSSAANELVVYDFTGIKIIMSTREDGRVNAIEFSKDEKKIAVGGAEKIVVIYEIIDNNTVKRKDQLGTHPEAVTSLCFFGESLLVVALKNGQVAIWNHLKVNLIKKIENLSPIKDIITFQKKYICFTSEDGKTRIVNMDEGRQIKVFRYSQRCTSIDTNQDDSLLYVGSSEGNILAWNLNCVKPTGKKVEFDRKAIDIDCTKIVTVENSRTLLIKDLFEHKEDIVEVKVDSDIEGVTFDDKKIIVLLKNGKYWEVGKKEYKFNNNSQYEGDLFFIRDKNFTNFFKSGLKKIRGMNKPALAVLEEVNS